MRQAAALLRFGRALRARLSRGETSAYAAALTYNFLFALFPLALTLAVLVPALHLAQAQQGLLSALTAVVPPEVVRLVTAAHGAERSRTAVGAAGVLGYLLGMSAAFRRLMEAFNRAQGAGGERRRPWWWVVALSVLLALTLGLGLVAAMVLMTVGQVLLPALLPARLHAAALAALATLRWLILLAVALLMLAVLYWVGPDGPRRFRLLTPGAVAAIAVWGSISLLFSAYLSRWNAYNALYGSVGAVILLLLYLYFLAYALLVGAEIDAMMASPRGAQGRRR